MELYFFRHYAYIHILYNLSVKYTLFQSMGWTNDERRIDEG